MVLSMTHHPEFPTTPEQPLRTDITIDTEVYQRVQIFKAVIDGLPLDEETMVEVFGTTDLSVEGIIDLSVRALLQHMTKTLAET